jgi:hypothetical protein
MSEPEQTPIPPPAPFEAEWTGHPLEQVARSVGLTPDFVRGVSAVAVRSAATCHHQNEHGTRWLSVPGLGFRSREGHAPAIVLYDHGKYEVGFKSKHYRHNMWVQSIKTQKLPPISKPASEATPIFEEVDGMGWREEEAHHGAVNL